MVYRDFIRKLEGKSEEVKPKVEHPWPFITETLYAQDLWHNRIKEVLCGERNLTSAFYWAASPQGRVYWSQQNYNVLTPEGRAILESWVADYGRG